MVFELLAWWYGPGWKQAIARIYQWARGAQRAFSAGLLLRTLFEPWRRIISVGGRSFDAKLRDAADNLVSRFVGASVRFLVLIAAMAAMIGAIVFGAIVAFAWPLIPLGILYCLYRGVAG
ncbi:MAG TPA: hypothetical protein VGS08_00565 [Candidatus Saccharimonadales bacterium]|nr:hypothetical protein [Candidatus Saccharimonadales bacterium]